MNYLAYFICCYANFLFATNDAFVKKIYQQYDEIFVFKPNHFYKRNFYITFYIIISLYKKQLDFKIIFSSKELKIRGLLESLAALFFLLELHYCHLQKFTFY